MGFKIEKALELNIKGENQITNTFSNSKSLFALCKPHTPHSAFEPAHSLFIYNFVVSSSTTFWLQGKGKFFQRFTQDIG